MTFPFITVLLKKRLCFLLETRPPPLIAWLCLDAKDSERLQRSARKRSKISPTVRMKGFRSDSGSIHKQIKSLSLCYGMKELQDVLQRDEHEKRVSEPQVAQVDLVCEIHGS